MSYFSDILSKFVTERNIKVYALAQYCNMDRANTYKIINGKRNPSSLTHVNKMADFLQLAAVERKELIEAYEITRIGEDVYFKRKKVENFLQSVGKSKSGKEIFEKRALKKERSEIENITGRYDIIQILSDLLYLETEKQTGKVYLMAKNEIDEVEGVLQKLLKEHSNLFVEQLFCIDNNKNETLEKYGYNLIILEKAISTYGCSRNYHPYYYYERKRAHMSDFNLLSSIIITTDYAFSFSMDLEYGILYHNAETVKRFQEIFQQLKKQTRPLLYEENSNDIKEKMRKIIQNSKENMVLFEKNPLFFRNMENERTNLLITEKSIKEMDKITKNILQTDLKNRNIWNLYKVLCEKIQFSENIIAIVSSISEGDMILQDEKGTSFFLSLNESGLQQAFYDYFSNIDQKYISSWS